ncbi:MAG TPA: winged helix-turn-helix domain-containing protein [Candidatus Binatia bacterium]|jgi:DNA-binding winged helix-turn-helix (wHTH) protein|nr:winged helix-turn-helix domain-containing protein [Candidatus Binatia bacterium]
MIHRFDGFELDRSKVELRRDDEVIPVEPQVFSLLLLLAENRERLVTRDEIIEKVWDGRIVSDSALDSRIKSARRALGDDGKAQRFIRTVHGQGFRFVAEVQDVSGIASTMLVHDEHAKPSLAVLPFRLLGEPGPYATIADALPDELIAELSRLRWLFVIDRGSSFRFRSAAPDLAEVGSLLGVRYGLSGTVEITDSTLVVTARLVDTRSTGVVWGDRLVSRIADVHATRSTILARLVAALELQIPLNEARAARLVAPENLDAWSAYHLGLQHMFRFNRNDNAAAGQLFARAVAEDASFARAHAGLSFVHFQNAFLRYTPDLHAEVRNARRAAERSVELDPLDPFANLTMGRSFWLGGELDTSLGWLDRATAISPNYAQGVYARTWTHTLSGRGAEGRTDADTAMTLSPLDPLHYAMTATRALSHMVDGETAEGAIWAERAARSPGAHVLIALIAAVAHTLNGDRTRAAAWAANARERNGAITEADFFRSFPFADPGTRQRIAKALATVGF